MSNSILDTGSSQSPHLQLGVEVVCVDLVEHVAVLMVVWVRIVLLLMLLLLFMMVLLHKLIVLLLSGNDPLFLAGGGRSSGGLSRGGRPADDGGGLGPERVAVVLGEGHLEECVGVAHELVDVPLP